MKDWLQRHRPRAVWLPIGVCLVGVLVALSFWGALVVERRQQLLGGTYTTADSAAAAIHVEQARQLHTLQGLGALWSEFGLRSEPEWMENVGQRVGSTPGLMAVAWIDRDTPRQRLSTEHSTHPIDTAYARREVRAPTVVGPIVRDGHPPGYALYLPVVLPDEGPGVIAGAFQLGPFFDKVLRGKALGFAVAIDWSGQAIYRREQASTDPWQDWWRVERVVELPLGGQWDLTLRPTPALAATSLTAIPHYLLATGILLSFALAFAVYQLRVIGDQSRSLAQRGAALEAEVEARTTELSELVQELEMFNYSVSHDLRSPLGAILNFVSILEEDYRGKELDAKGASYLSRIRRSAMRATRLLEDLHEISRAGRAELEMRDLDMTGLAREIFAQVRAAENDFDVEFVSSPLPPARGDRALLEAVFSNLYSNAFKYSRGCEKRRISVSGRVEGDECVYVVTDTGTGFEMRFVDKLFGLFERLHNDEEIEGTGVGLALVARIVRRHGGRVQAEGRPGEGAEFTFTLPRATE